MKPLITLGVSCYNAEQSIARALDSALAQTWENKEIVVVDDHSTDDSLKIVEGFKSRYPEQVRIFRNEKNCGIAVVRNEIIRRARGNYIAFFDDDDTSVPDRAWKQHQALKKIGEDKLALCHTARIQISPDGRSHHVPTFATEKTVCGEKVALRILTGKPFSGESGGGATCSQMASARTYRKLGGFDPALRKGEDTDFNIRLSLRGGHFVGVAEPLVVQTMTPTSDKKASIEKKYCVMIFEKHRPFLEKEGCYGFCLKWINVKFDFISNNKKDFAKNFLWLTLRHPVRVLLRVWWALPNFGYNLRHRSQRSSL